MSDELPPAGREEGNPERSDRFLQVTPGEWRRIFREVAAGGASALEDLYQVASKRVFGLALWRTGSRDDACDVVQDVFVRVAERRDRLAKVRDPRAWLLAVAHRLAVDVVRRRGRRRNEPLERCPYLEARGEDATRAVDAARVSALLAQLPPAQREAIYLHEYAGCTFSAIAGVTGVPTFTAASRYRLGLEKLRRLMKGE